MDEEDVQGFFHLIIGLLDEVLSAAEEDDPTRRKRKIATAREKLQKAELTRFQALLPSSPAFAGDGRKGRKPNPARSETIAV
jgi:hypothetical protein